jgi:hypothetical protein
MTETAAAVPEVYAAVMAVMAAVTNVPKSGVGPREHGGYSYRKLDDAVDAVGAAFREHALMVQSTVRNVDYTEYEREGRNGVTRWNRCTLTIQYRFTSLVDGSFLEFEAIGQGLDSSDKSSNKAMSGALKYALSQAFMLATGELDPDGETPQVTGRPVEGETAAQRTLRERRAAQGQSASPATEPAPVDEEPAAQPQAAPAQPEGPDEATVQQTERDATVALTGAAKESANAETNNQTIKLQTRQIDRARKAIQVAATIGDRFTLNRVILQCRQEGFLAATVDGKNVGATLAAARGMLS